MGRLAVAACAFDVMGDVKTPARELTVSGYFHSRATELDCKRRSYRRVSKVPANILVDLPSTVLIDLYGKPLNTHQPIFLLNAYYKTDFVSSIAAAIKGSKVHYRSFDPAENPRFMIIQTISEVTASAGVVIPFLEPYVEDAERHNIRAAFLAGLAHGLGREALLIRHRTGNAAPGAADFRDDVVSVRSEAEVIEKVTAFCTQTLICRRKSPPISAVRQRSFRRQFHAPSEFISF